MISVGDKSIDWTGFLEKFPVETLLSYYLGITEVPCLICSPFRIDKTPSLSIHEYNGRIFYTDFGTGEKGSAIDLVCKYLGIRWTELPERVTRDSLGKVNPLVIKPVKVCKGRSSCRTLQVTARDFLQKDLDYWESYGISRPMLEWSMTYPISHTFIQRDGLSMQFPAESLAYVYVEFQPEVSLKVYQPKSLKYKWMSDRKAEIWDLWNLLPETGKNLIITSSRKDAMCIWENSGIPSVAPQSEAYLPDEKHILDLKKRFKNVYVLYDNDYTKEQNWGRKYGRRVAETFGMTQLEIPGNFLSKDPSDLCLHYGRKQVKDFILSLVN